MSGVFKDDLEQEQWMAKMKAAKTQLQAAADHAGRKRDQAIADGAHDVTGIFGGVPLPEGVADAVAIIKRGSSFLPLLPLDAALGPKNGELIRDMVHAFELLTRVLGVK
jgi:hypothetical protein